MGQVDDKHGEYNGKVTVRKEMIINTTWWTKPKSLNIYLNEYQLYDTCVNDTPIVKRRLLCQTNYYFFEEVEEDYIQKCEVTIKDRDKKLCFKKTYSQIDRWNRRFYTNQ